MIRISLPTCLLLICGAAAFAETVEIPTTGNAGYGTYQSDGTFLDNHGFVGSSSTIEKVTYFTWNLASVTEPILSAQIEFLVGANGLAGMEQLVAHEVSTPLTTLEAGLGSFATLVGGATFKLMRVRPVVGANLRLKVISGSDSVITAKVIAYLMP